MKNLITEKSFKSTILASLHHNEIHINPESINN